MDDVSDGAVCQVCGGRGLPYVTHEGMALRHCPDCALVFMDPMPDAATISALYTDAYGGAAEGYFSKVDSKMRRCRRRARWLARRAPGRRFLDVGCNGGFMAEAMRERGFESHGIDPDPVSIAWAREHYPGNCFHVASVERFTSGELFNVVYCSEVIEHVTDLNGFVASIATAMAPGGVLFLTTPDMGHWRRPRDLTAWSMFTPPRHCIYFNRDNLTRLLSRHGLRIVHRRPAFKPGIKVLARKAGG